jgi:hypothetical protein
MEIAMIELTEVQREELKEREPLAIDPQTQEKYVLIRKGAYDRMPHVPHPGFRVDADKIAGF